MGRSSSTISGVTISRPTAGSMIGARDISPRQGGRRSIRAVGVAVAIAFALSAVGALSPDVAIAQPKSRFTPARKVGRGFANTILGFLAIPGQMTQQTRERGAATGLPIGFGMGLGYFVASELIGIYEILSCPFEAPPGYKPILDPEFPWEYFEE
jgi:putative exosortase-associated protein (TIGR04073 family)